TIASRATSRAPASTANAAGRSCGTRRSLLCAGCPPPKRSASRARSARRAALSGEGVEVSGERGLLAGRGVPVGHAPTRSPVERPDGVVNGRPGLGDLASRPLAAALTDERIVLRTARLRWRRFSLCFIRLIAERVLATAVFLLRAGARAT